MTSPMRVPTTAGRPLSSASRPATSPMIPTGHGPWRSRAGASAPAPTVTARVSVARSGNSGSCPGASAGSGSPSATRASAMAARIRSRRVALAASSVAASVLGLGRVLGEQQAGGVERLPHPPRGVESRRDGEPDGLEVGCGGFDAGPREEGRDPRPRGGAHPLEAEPRDRTVLAQHGDDVGHGADHGELRERQGFRLGVRQLAEQQARDGERDAAAGQAGIRVVAVRTVRVDDRDRRREHLRQAMVVGHDDVDRPGASRRDLGDARGPGVDRDDQRDAVGRRRVDRGQREPVALLEARRDVRRDVDAEAAEREDQLREPRQPVRVEVAEDHDVLATIPRAGHAVEQRRRVRQASRVVESRRRGAQERREGIRVRDATPGHHGGGDGADAEVPRRGAEHGIEPVRLGEHPAVPCVGHRAQDATNGLSATWRRRRQAGGRPSGSCGRGSRTSPGPRVTWPGGGLGEPQSPAPGGDPPRGATRRGAGSR